MDAHDHAGQIIAYGECITCARTAYTPAEPDPTVARDDGIARAETGAGVDWIRHARLAVAQLTATVDEFTTDDVWALVPPTAEPRAMGAVMTWAREVGYVERTDRTVQSTRPEAHARPVRVWRSRHRPQAGHNPVDPT